MNWWEKASLSYHKRKVKDLLIEIERHKQWVVYLEKGYNHASKICMPKKIKLLR